jgi:NAD+ kinase
LLTYLQSKDLSIVLEEVTGNLLPGHGQKQCPRNELAKDCELVVVVGGDGSMLNVAKAIANEQVPVIGINRGRLGFLTDILPEKLEQQLDDVLAGNYGLDSRFLLDVSTINDKGPEQIGCALNDVVLHPGSSAQMIEFELFVDDKFVYSQVSDGLIVATPTGSTAYALSAGGPIMHPGLNAVVLVPMYPHSLSSRPIVVDGDSEIRLVIAANNARQPQLSCDGELKLSTSPGDEILITKKAVPLKLIHPAEHSFYQACRSKLGWGNRLVRPDD